jgi:two-component sensor histidine kinase
VSERQRADFMHTALGPVVVIWAFGYALVDLLAFLLGRTAPALILIASTPMFILGVAQTLALDRLRRHVRTDNPGLLLLLVMALFAATSLQSLFDLYWLRWLALTLLPAWQGWALDTGFQRLAPVALIYLWTFCLALVLLWASRVGIAAEARAASAEAAAARAEASQHQAEAALHRSQSAALRLQLNPHFLFNTLNSISSLVVLERNGKAEEMIELLCDFLRASLNADPMADVPLAQEIDTINAYLGIEAARFGDRLDVDMAIDGEAAEILVPNFILQPLVENAIKHGVAAVRGPALIRVTVARERDALVLSVDNSAPAVEEQPEELCSAALSRFSTGIGLANIRQRLSNRYGERAKLSAQSLADRYIATIRLPLQERQAAVEAAAE